MTPTALVEELELEVEDESARILRWRCDELRRAGYSVLESRMLAISAEVDLHVATDLLADGCPSMTAVRILL